MVVTGSSLIEGWSRRAILVGVAVQKCHYSTQRSERVCPRGRPWGHPAIKYAALSIDSGSIQNFRTRRSIEYSINPLWCCSKSLKMSHAIARGDEDTLMLSRNT
jgi:hypothetical protein